MGRASRLPRRPLPTDTAIHEAGHAVAAVLLGLPLIKVTLEPDYERGWRGVTTIHDPSKTHVWKRITEQELREYAVFCLAGSVAEALFFPAEHTFTDGERLGVVICEDDVHALRPIVDDEWLSRASALAGSFVLQHRDLILRVARALDETTTLSGAEVHALCGKVASATVESGV
jgi:hypothetical protein